MKINKITYNISQAQINNRQKKAKTQYSEKGLLMSYPAEYYMPSFRGINLGKMYEEYNWYINHDRVPAIKSFLKMTYPKEIMEEFLTHILETKDRSYELIDSITHMPRESVSITKALGEKIGTNSKILMPFLPDNPYNKAYTNYIEQKYERDCIIELLKIRPDWSEQALINKYESKFGNKKLKIGKLPKQIPQEHLDQILPYLKSKMEIGLKNRQQIDDLVIDNKTYQFLFYTEGKSSKNVFRITIPSVAKKYIIKMDIPENRSLDKPFALGTLAKIDSYLTLNRSRNSAPLCYYDHDGNFSIYKYIEHAHIDKQTNDINEIRKHLPDFRALGLDYNDTVGYKNYFKLEKDSIDTHNLMEGFDEALDKNEWISVDNDHVTYSNRFQPSINGFHKPLPNAMGMFF
jgi:hypothetical protein